MTPLHLRAIRAVLILPGTFAGVIPAGLVYFDPWRFTGHISGAAGVMVGVAILLWCVRDFLAVGLGTLSPWNPPQRLVVVGLYRHVRNPMYVGITMLLIGWTAWAGSPLLAGYAAALAVAFHLRVVLHEEPRLAEQFGEPWRRYCRHVGRWWPRITPWRLPPDEPSAGTWGL